MTTQNSGVAKYQTEQAAARVKDRYKTVLNSREAKGKADLAMVLLGTELTCEEIITALSKSPTPSANAESPPPPVQQNDPTLAVYEGPNVSHSWWDPQLFAAGEASAKMILGKQ